MKNTIDVLLSKLEVKADDNERYSRRSCLRIHGINKYDENSSNENMEDILSNCYEKVDVPFNHNEINRVHRIGKPFWFLKIEKYIFLF